MKAQNHQHSDLPNRFGLPSLPAGWCWTTLDDIAKIGTGTTPSRSESRYWNGGTIPWITSSAVNHLSVREAAEFVTHEALAETTLKLYPKHTMILALYGEGKTRGKVSELLIDATINQALAAVEFSGDCTELRPFVKSYLQSRYASLRRQAAGGMQPNLNLGLVKRIRIPVAPLNEQRRIVAKIDELFSDLDAAVAALERVRAKLKRYRAAVLKAAVEGKVTEEWRKQHRNTEPASILLDRILKERCRRWEEAWLARFDGENKEPPKGWQRKYQAPTGPDTTSLPELPESWCWATVDQLITFLKNGLSTKPSADPPGQRILRINAVRPAKVDLEEVRYLPGNHAEWADYFIENGGWSSPRKAGA